MLISELGQAGLWQYVILALVVAIAAFLQGVGGVGFAMFAAPVAVVFFPELVPGPLLALGGSVSLLAALRERQHIIPKVVATAVSGRAVGTIFAVLAMTQLSKNVLELLFGVFILIAVLLSISGLRIAPNRKNMGIAGVVSGIMGTLTSVGAPSLAIAMQNLVPANLRASLGATLFLGASFSLFSLGIAGLFTLREAILSAILWPFMLLGFSLSSKVRHAVSAIAVKRLLLGFCSISAIGLIFKSLF
ncbi:sulfite exporter TauE/SafE family protein [Paenalcaligenes niemegkensis]|uniref:sulfite exporter TauE/SafE family protein n=1 Tax=Paenalcaligenes niemegkensis TaxID=2895469 RepID=UPI001EE82499|nr:sulfite exporter TauE/SafE family protein [Paenalcaligenes niemegkensis]MCQ9617753.1 sulfite exporter TauE/SafE family protein [Paenalcaligenes niemegkensis]